MNFSIKLKQLDVAELSGYIVSVAGSSTGTGGGGGTVTLSGITGYALPIPYNTSGVHVSWASQPLYLNMTVHSSGANDPLLMGNLRGFNSTGCSFYLSDATQSSNYFLHLSYPV